MKKQYLIQRRDTGEFYRFRPYGNRWEKDWEKAKVFKRKCDAANAINCMRLQGTYATMRIMVVLVETKFTNEFFDYLYFPEVKIKKLQ